MPVSRHSPPVTSRFLLPLSAFPVLPLGYLRPLGLRFSFFLRHLLPLTSYRGLPLSACCLLLTNQRSLAASLALYRSHFGQGSGGMLPGFCRLAALLKASRSSSRCKVAHSITSPLARAGNSPSINANDDLCRVPRILDVEVGRKVVTVVNLHHDAIKPRQLRHKRAGDADAGKLPPEFSPLPACRAHPDKDPTPPAKPRHLRW